MFTLCIALFGVVLLTGCGTDTVTDPVETNKAALNAATSTTLTLNTMDGAETTLDVIENGDEVANTPPDDGDKRDERTVEPTTWGELKIMFPDEKKDDGDNKKDE